MQPGRVTVATLAAVILIALDAPAWADADNRAWTDGAGIAAQATQAPTAPTSGGKGGGGRGGASPVTCTYLKLPPDEAALGDRLAAEGSGQPKGPGPGTWYAKMCTDTAANVSTGTVVWVPDPAPASPATLAEQALRYAPIPVPGVGMNPPPERDQLVRLPVWLWVDPAGWTPVSASASAGGITVTVRAVPVRVVWDMGNGDAGLVETAMGGLLAC